ncbi:putative Williams-Beuren syndrome chromosomal region 27 protein [Apostichopus japonicus]|uniref:Putative Williams-Beuren syndrome chromosomal region 27 protein n=1 Tax=Stichopus japonicus TaxID=307972 RepID=A0A2G8JKV8_STIJA|nr:putative Williams-Beuren syndrome chromosomal region 27 protein [Apostichopus japonicus]
MIATQLRPQDFETADYKGPRLGAEKLAEFVKDKRAKILDAGCGVGTVGLQLKKLGYSNLDGVDLSPRSVDACKALNIYQKLIIDKLGDNQLDIAENSYDGVISIGTFIPGHVNQSAFLEFLRVVKPGGYIVIGMREEFLDVAKEFQNGQLEGEMKRLADEKRWEWVQREAIIEFFAGKPGVHFVFKYL